MTTLVRSTNSLQGLNAWRRPEWRINDLGIYNYSGQQSDGTVIEVSSSIAVMALQLHLGRNSLLMTLLPISSLCLDMKNLISSFSSERTYFSCGGRIQTKTDLRVVNRNCEILLAMQEDKSNLEGMDPEPQLIAETISAYQYNDMYLRRIGLPIIQAKVVL